MSAPALGRRSGAAAGRPGIVPVDLSVVPGLVLGGRLQASRLYPAGPAAARPGAGVLSRGGAAAPALPATRCRVGATAESPGVPGHAAGVGRRAWGQFFGGPPG